MKALVAQNPVRLGPARAFELAMSGMRYRLFRSTVTIAILALAVAFLAHTASHGLLGAAVRASAAEELNRSRALGQYLTRLSIPDSPALIRRTLSLGEPRRLAEYRAWGALSEAELAAARDTAKRLAELTAALDHLPPAARGVVLADESAEEVVTGVNSADAAAALGARLERAGARVAGADTEALAELLARGRPELERVVERIGAGHRRAIEAFAATLGGQPVRAVAARPLPDFAARVRASSFDFPDADAAALAAFAERREELQRISQLLLEPETRAAVARELRIPVGDVGVETVAPRLRGARRQQWFAEVVQRAGGGGALTGARIGELFAAHGRERRLESSLGGEPGEAGAQGSANAVQGALPTSTLVLIGLSFLVCVVGVANAMLMSVTERFTEIATMKCLGGLDGFIMGLFVFEAVIQGVIGGAIGGVLGLLLAVARGLFEFGGLLSGGATAIGPVLLSVAAAFVVGIVLAALAAVGPAWLAARLAPMEAMRVD